MAIDSDISLPTVNSTSLLWSIGIVSQEHRDKSRWKKHTAVLGQAPELVVALIHVAKYGFRIARGYAAGDIDADTEAGEMERMPVRMTTNVDTMDVGSELNMVVVERKECSKKGRVGRDQGGVLLKGTASAYDLVLKLIRPAALESGSPRQHNERRLVDRLDGSRKPSGVRVPTDTYALSWIVKRGSRGRVHLRVADGYGGNKDGRASAL